MLLCAPGSLVGGAPGRESDFSAAPCTPTTSFLLAPDFWLWKRGSLTVPGAWLRRLWLCSPSSPAVRFLQTHLSEQSVVPRPCLALWARVSSRRMSMDSMLRAPSSPWLVLERWCESHSSDANSHPRSHSGSTRCTPTLLLSVRALSASTGAVLGTVSPRGAVRVRTLQLSPWCDPLLFSSLFQLKSHQDSSVLCRVATLRKFLFLFFLLSLFFMLLVPAIVFSSLLMKI